MRNMRVLVETPLRVVPLGSSEEHRSPIALKRGAPAWIGVLTAAVAFLLSARGIAQTISPTESTQERCPATSVQDAPILTELAKRQIEPGGPPLDILKLPAPMMAELQETGKKQAQDSARDWGNVCRYKAANTELLKNGVRPDVVLVGDSITENWKRADSELFTKAVIDRGIGGQTSSQILLRFYGDVVLLHPSMVQILAGTNDLGTGISDGDFLNNIRAMIDLAESNHISVILASIPPSRHNMRGLDPLRAPQIQRLNKLLREIATERRATFVDYYSVLADGDGGMRPNLSNDDIHPTRDGYALMRPLLEQAIAHAKR